MCVSLPHSRYPMSDVNINAALSNFNFDVTGIIRDFKIKIN